jgi:hypothetical protein
MNLNKLKEQSAPPAAEPPLSILLIALKKMRRNLLEVACWCCEQKLLINPGKPNF